MSTTTPIDHTKPQLPPEYHGYRLFSKGGFARVTRCCQCGAIGLREDAHPVRPCRLCGGVVSNYGAAEWSPRITKWSWRKFRFVTVYKGAWCRLNQPVEKEA